MPLPLAAAAAAAARAAAAAARVAIPAAKAAIKKHGPKAVKYGKEVAKKAKDKAKDLWAKLKKKFSNKKGTCQACGPPEKAKNVLKQIEKNNGAAPKGFKGGKNYKNDGRGGGEVLPKTDAKGNPVSYKEYDVNPFSKGVNRGAERIVRGSDGKAYYTSDHYGSFTPMN